MAVRRARSAQGQHLPQCLTGRRQEIDPAIGSVAQVPDAESPGQGGGVQQQAACAWKVHDRLPSDNRVSVAREGRALRARFCQVVEAETRIRQAGASPRSSPPLRRPVPSLSLRPNSRSDAPSPRSTPTRTAEAVWGGRGGPWGHTQTTSAGGPTDCNPCMRRSRWRVGRGECSHRFVR